MRRVLIATTVLLLAAPASAAAGPDWHHSFQVNVLTSPRMWEDASAVQFALPLSVQARVHGKLHRRIPFSGYTISRRSVGEVLREARRKYHEGNAFIERPLKARERRHFRSRLVWVDGDVLAVHPTDPLCRSGSSLGAVRDLLTAPAGGRDIYVPAGLTGDPEHLFGLEWDRGPDAYGRGIKAVGEGSAVAAVASSPGSVAAVAWSAARWALDAGRVCAVPLAGVAPTEATLRDRSYPAAVHAHLVYKRRNGFRGLGYAKRWYLNHLRSAETRELLATSRGRARLLP